ncbi:MAG TPA: MerR family transcriptional regulator [Desulforhopalus sp.]|nr:MerR family transcriptional regulator [Desulforhopalus sp.]
MKAIPDKLYFKIGEVARLAEVPTHVLRYWESEFPEISPKRANSGQRLYRRQDLELILRVRNLLHHEGYTIAGARRLLAARPNPSADSARQKNLIPSTARLRQVKDELKKILELLSKKRDWR